MAPCNMENQRVSLLQIKTLDSGKGNRSFCHWIVQRGAPSVLVPTVLERYVDGQACRSYTLLSKISGEDLNEAWIKLEEEK